MNPWRMATLALLLTACGGNDKSEDSGSTAVETPTFTEIRDEVLFPSCAFSSCHGGGAGGLTLSEAEPDSAYAALVGAIGASNLPLVTAGDSSNSYLIDKIEDADTMVSGTSMHPGSSLLSTEPDTVAGIRAWIDAGAPDN
ncbi:MAG: hypothetical protein GWP91_00570 [Rhodobacterales bacterium]|nr:hypothetical protein [Rhodobacterales bacterium]